MLLSCVLGGRYSHKFYGWPFLLCCRSLVPTQTCSTNEDKGYQAFKRSEVKKSEKSWATEVNSGAPGVDGGPELVQCCTSLGCKNCQADPAAARPQHGKLRSQVC